MIVEIHTTVICIMVQLWMSISKTNHLSLHHFFVTTRYIIREEYCLWPLSQHIVNCISVFVCEHLRSCRSVVVLFDIFNKGIQFSYVLFVQCTYTTALNWSILSNCTGVIWITLVNDQIIFLLINTNTIKKLQRKMTDRITIILPK